MKASKHVDEYAGGKDWLLGLWPGANFTKNDHAHLAAEGGYYNHRHQGGDQLHNHEKEAE